MPGRALVLEGGGQSWVQVPGRALVRADGGRSSVPVPVRARVPGDDGDQQKAAQLKNVSRHCARLSFPELAP